MFSPEKNYLANRLIRFVINYEIYLITKTDFLINHLIKSLSFYVITKQVF
jgi:hypothetical protein